MVVIRVKDGVEFNKIAPAGFRILSAVDDIVKGLTFDVTVTSGTDGEHSGPTDPHHRGEAYDVRSHDFPDQETKEKFLSDVMNILGFGHFYGFIEAPGTESEHFHFQVRKGTVYP